MKFETISIQSIKSISQRALAIHWDRLSQGRSFPSFGDFRPESRLHDPNQLVMWAVEDHDNRRRFRSLYQGTEIAEIFNSAWAGRTMDTVAPEFTREIAIDAANECADTGCAIYNILTTTDAAGHHVDCERLLLPLGRDGGAVAQIIASLQFISLKGDYDRKSILGMFQRHMEVTLAGKIPSGFTQRNAACPVEAAGVLPAPPGTMLEVSSCDGM